MLTLVTFPPREAPARGRRSGPSDLDVEIVIPVFNEERALAASVYRLHTFLTRQLPFSWTITIADNASTDDTPQIARTLAAQLNGVSVLRLEQKGRGRALRAAWTSSAARVAAYMDVDLSTDLRGLLPLIAPLLSDLCGVARLMLANPGVRFAAIGVISTLAYALLFLAFASWLGAGAGSALALSLTAVANTAANRRLTFGVRGRSGLLRQHAAGLIVFLIALGLTSGALDVLHRLDPHPPRPLEAAGLVVASLAATVTRYVALSSWVFRPEPVALDPAGPDRPTGRDRGGVRVEPHRLR